MEQPEWLEVPWSLSNKPKPYTQHLHDISCPISGFIEEMNELQRVLRLRRLQKPVSIENEGCIEEGASKLGSRIERQLFALQQWMDEWMRMFPQAYWSNSSLSESEDYPTSLFGIPLQFVNFPRCHDFVQYYDMRYELCRLLERLQELFPCRNAQDLGPSRQSQYCSSVSADLICRSVPFLLNSSIHGSAGALVSRWSLFRLFPSYHSGTEQYEWMLRMLERFKTLGVGGGKADLEADQESEQLQETRETS